MHLHDDMPIETKGIDGQVRVSSFVRNIFFSNNRTPIKIPFDDRRFQANKHSAEKKNNQEYFENLVICIFSISDSSSSCNIGYLSFFLLN